MRVRIKHTKAVPLGLQSLGIRFHTTFSERCLVYWGFDNLDA